MERVNIEFVKIQLAEVILDVIHVQDKWLLWKLLRKATENRKYSRGTKGKAIMHVYK